ncbi:SirA-like protein [Anaeromyxobacter sp. K]|uniref:sulfurtransferase-like selenium metabolism protein YedF n=1 Tax=Anaeromyxobacter sp. (strain K) TaxID=447217 RepID=UPI00015F9F8B|nr:sulfurtransferase-like selenium metabolism protein YedF [Anaeromyxobacter sp. K]ACG71815.1 SirA-like protein [Anaeromyxobacter sp. K]
MAEATARQGGTVVVVNAEQMGRGDDGLGAKLLGNYLRTLASLEPKPEAIVFYNGAVRLLGPGSAHLEALRQLDDAGVDLLACITCLEFFQLTGKLEVGHVSNMREIAQRTLAAAKVITL